MRSSGRLIRWPSTESGARRICRPGSAMVAFDYRQASEVRDAFARHGVRYLFIGKSGAILLGFPDTTQDADLFLEKSTTNGDAALAALRELGFTLSDSEAEEV